MKELESLTEDLLPPVAVHKASNPELKTRVKFIRLNSKSSLMFSIFVSCVAWMQVNPLQ